MLTRRLMAATALFFLTLPAPAQPISTGAMPGPDDRARQWLALVDDGNTAESWNQAGAAFKARITTARWAAEAAQVRAPLGAMTHRDLKDVKLVRTMPGMPDGQYAVVRYDSSFAHKATAIESVVLSLSKNSWSVVGYHIN